MNIYLAADHAGFLCKERVQEHLVAKGYEVQDCGAYEEVPTDNYPEIIRVAGEKLSANPADRAIVFGGSGQGEAMVMNRFPHVRCAVFYGNVGEQEDARGTVLDMIRSVREHNDANALSIGARFASQEEIIEAIDTWLETPFPGDDRHVRRIHDIDEPKI